MVTAKLICTFVFAYTSTKTMFSHDAAQHIFLASTKWIYMITFASVGCNKSQYFLNNVSGDMNRFSKTVY